ncbi:MAG: hypothetical protein L0221_07485 [Chloroflexi bacterium]|nr:hypothetical protein [Chloroflexota bacterium]
MNRDVDPRDPAGPTDDDIEIVELHETRLPTRLDVAPTSVGAGAKTPRLHARLAAVIAVAIVMIAILGTGPLAPQPSPSPSDRPAPSNDTAVATNAPETTADPCPTVDRKLPMVTLGSARLPHAATASTPEAAGFEVPTKYVTEVRPGQRISIVLNDRRCVELVGIDIVDTNHANREGLTVRIPSPLEPNARSVAWDTPPAGDWVVRVAVLLRGFAPEDAAASWAIYFFRVNSGFVAWASPVPEVAAGQGDGPLVTPAASCASVPDDPAPPAVELHVGEQATRGILGEYDWRGMAFAGGVQEALLASGPIEVDGPVTLRIAGDVCATSWYITAGVLAMGGEEPMDSQQYYIDQSPENPSNDPQIAAQNAFSPGLSVFGTYVLRAAFEFANGDLETAYWLLHVPLGPLPEARAFAGGSLDPVTLLQGCGAEFSTEDGYGVEVCSADWPTLPDGPQLALAADNDLHIGADSRPISGWVVQFAQLAEIEAAAHPGCPYILTSGYSGLGLESLVLPAFPPGAWVVRVTLTYRDAEDSMTVPYFVRVSVEGEPIPLPAPRCGDF